MVLTGCQNHSDVALTKARASTPSPETEQETVNDSRRHFSRQQNGPTQGPDMRIAPVRLCQVDAFTDKPFLGNPAAVCLVAEPRDHVWMQHVALEMNLSETAFVTARTDGDFDLRWFTPTTEVDLCGHATLASAHVVWEEHLLSHNSAIRFHTRSGVLTARRLEHGIEMDFPAQPEGATQPPRDLVEALGVTPEYVGRNATDYLIELASESAVRDVQPDFRRLVGVPMRGVMITAAGSSRVASPRYDFVSRFFAPAAGVDEDPVTGSAHCCLGPFWQRQLGRDRLVGFQASSRGGYVGLWVKGGRVLLSGQAVTVFRAEMWC